MVGVGKSAMSVHGGAAGVGARWGATYLLLPADFAEVTSARGVKVPLRWTIAAPGPRTSGVNAPFCSPRSTCTGWVPSLPKVTFLVAEPPSRTVALRLPGVTVRWPAWSVQFLCVVAPAATFTWAVAGVYFPSVAWNLMRPVLDE